MDNKWQDRPDRKGLWWMLIKGGKLTTRYIDMPNEVNCLSDLDIKWLYIPEPELPEREQLNQKIFQSESKYGYSQFE